MSVGLRLFGTETITHRQEPLQRSEATLLREDLGLFAVVRGFGGEQRSALAKETVLATLERHVAETVEQTLALPDVDVLGIPEQAKRLSLAMHTAHSTLLDLGANNAELAGLSACATAILDCPRTGKLHIAHVGDNRCYRLRHGRLERLTQDNTLAEDVLELRPSTPESVLATLDGHAVVRSLGVSGELRVKTSSLLLAPEERYLLCTRGLWGRLTDTQLVERLRGSPRADVLEFLANALGETGATEEAPAVLVDVEELAPQEEYATRPYNERPLP